MVFYCHLFALFIWVRVASSTRAQSRAQSRGTRTLVRRDTSDSFSRSETSRLRLNIVFSVNQPHKASNDGFVIRKSRCHRAGAPSLMVVRSAILNSRLWRVAGDVVRLGTMARQWRIIYMNIWWRRATAATIVSLVLFAAVDSAVWSKECIEDGIGGNIEYHCQQRWHALRNKKILPPPFRRLI